MSVREILKDGEPQLRMQSRAVVDFDEKLHVLLDDMWDTMDKADGVGLAAPQVGILRRIAIIDTGDDALELINPVVICEKGKQTGEEGCLSVPGRREMVTRASKVEIAYQDRAGAPKSAKLKGLSARATLHEIDHLNGVLYYDLADKP